MAILADVCLDDLFIEAVEQIERGRPSWRTEIVSPSQRNALTAMFREHRDSKGRRDLTVEVDSTTGIIVVTPDQQLVRTMIRGLFHARHRPFTVRYIELAG